MNIKNTLKAHKHNDLIQARYSSMTTPEQLLLLAVIAQNDPRKLTAETPVELTVSAFRDLVDAKGGSSYEELKKAVRRLYNRSVIIINPDPNDSALTEIETRWISSIHYYKGEGRIKLYFAPKIIPYLTNLNKNYTSFFIHHVAKFRSSYGIRLYELLVQWQGKGSREINVEWLRKIWKLENKYKAIKDLKKDVITPALSDINEHSNLWVRFGQRKIGRKIMAFQFEFGLKSDQKNAKLTPKEWANLPANRQRTIGKTLPEIKKMMSKK